MNTLYMIGNTHFDPVWLWTWDEAMASIRSTFRSALERMKEDPDFYYSFAAPAVFEWIEQTDPEMFREIQQRVAEGRWEVESEGWWLQPDCNAPSGESLVRHGVYGQGYLKSRFGKTANAVFDSDSFGHNAMIPQILRKSGMRHYLFSRPSKGEQALEDNLFRWHAPDGSEVLTYRVGAEGVGCYPQDTADCIRKHYESILAVNHDTVLVYGVSNHGGAPTKKAIADIHQMRQEIKDVDVRFGTMTQFYEAQKEKCTSDYTGELQPLFYGTFSNHTEVKRNNRRGEYCLDRTEKAAFLSNWLCGRPYPKAMLDRSWKDLMFNQFHDTLGGTCIPDVFVDTRNQHGRLMHNANEEMHFAIQSICRRIRTFGDNQSMVWNVCVFNFNTQPYSGVVEAEVQWAWEFPWYKNGIELVDENGNVIPAQIIQEKCVLPGFRSRFAFRAELPAMGWRTYAVRKNEKTVERSFDDVDVQSPFKFLVLDDPGDTWSFNTTDGYGEPCEAPALESRKTVEVGSQLTRVKQVWTFRRSIIEEYITTYPDTDAVDYRYRVHWNEQHKVLKLVPAAKVDAERVTAAIPYGSIERPMDGREYPVGDWISWGGENPATLLMEGVSAYDSVGGPRLTLLRSPIYGDLRMGELDYRMDYQFMEQGTHEGRIRYIPHQLDNCSAAAQSMQWNQQPVVVDEANHGGDLPPVCGGLTWAGEGAAVTAVKGAEDGNGFVVRIVEYNGVGCKGKVTLGDHSAEVDVKPYEIKTLRILADGTAVETDMLETLPE